MNQEILNKLQKLKELASKGYGGEKQNAEELITKLLEKYHLSEDDLIEDKVSQHEFQFWGHLGRKLFNQIVYTVLGDVDIYHYTHSRNCKTRFVNCTEAEAIEIQEMFNFYRGVLDEGFEDYYQAFVNVEGLFPDPSKVTVQTQNTAPRRKNASKLACMMDKHNRTLLITDGKEK